MALTFFSTYDPFFSEIENSMNRAFDRPLGVLSRPAKREVAPQTVGIVPILDVWRPLGGTEYPMDIVEKANEFEIVADAPGMRPEDVTVELDKEKGVITIRGEHKHHKETKDASGKVIRSERVSRSFFRSFGLPTSASAEEEKVAATLSDGILRVTVPRKPKPAPVERRQPTRITVKAGNNNDGGDVTGSGSCSAEPAAQSTAAETVSEAAAEPTSAL